MYYSAILVFIYIFCNDITLYDTSVSYAYMDSSSPFTYGV